MKRTLIFFLLLLFVTAGIIAEERTLIDFTEIGDPNEDNPDNQVTIVGKTHHRRTVIDFSNSAESMDLSPESQKEMMVSLALDQWEIQLASSSQTVTNMRQSETKSVTSKEYGQVLGARIHFPDASYNSWAIIQPPFEIPAYATPTVIDSESERPVELEKEEINQLNENNPDVESPEDEGWEDMNSKFNGYGVLKNVDVIKSLSLNVYGTNYPHGIAVRIKDEQGMERDLFLGHLDFDGWKEMTWTNPNYIEDVRDRTLITQPLYPYATPHIKLMGIVIYRDGANIGGDFVVYFRDITVVYDKAVLTYERDIDDEEAWGIMEEREAARKQAEQDRVGDIQLLRYIESRKMHEIEEDEEGTNTDQ
jgi:hypothetical protein